MAKNRLIGDYPVIGIRPTIDGRRGPLKVRESLEDQTMAMAQAAKELFEKNICYSNGEPVKVVIADTTIGRVAESAACAAKFKKEGVDITLTVTPCWCYGSETMDMDPMTIKGVWGFNGTERPGAVYLASVLATHAQKGLPAFGIYGHDVQNLDEVTNIPEDVQEKLLRFGRAAVAVATMRGKSYLQIGSICMGIGGSIIDPAFIEEYLGMRVESVDEVEIIRRMSEGIYDAEEVARAKAWIAENCKEGWDKNPDFVKTSDEKKAEQWDFLAKMYCIIKDLFNGNPNLPEGREEVNFYEPEWDDKDEDFIEKAGHGGGDYIVGRMFIDCIKSGKQPEHPYDIHSAVTMSSVAILAHRSVLNGGTPYDIPDFHLEERRKQYENDNDTPFYGSDGSIPTIPCCSKTDYKPTQEQISAYLETLKN